MQTKIRAYSKMNSPSPARHQVAVFSSEEAEWSDRISLTGNSWLHIYRLKNKHVIGERATGKARQSLCDAAAENKFHLPSLTRR